MAHPLGCIIELDEMCLVYQYFFAVVAGMHDVESGRGVNDHPGVGSEENGLPQFAFSGVDVCCGILRRHDEHGLVGSHSRPSCVYELVEGCLFHFALPTDNAVALHSGGASHKVALHRS